MYVNTYVCKYLCMYIYVHIYVCIYVYIYISICIHILMYVYIYISCICINTYAPKIIITFMSQIVLFLLIQIMLRAAVIFIQF